MLPDLERRAATIGGVKGTRIIGHAVVFGARSRDLGGFVEIVRPQAVERALRDGADVVALYRSRCRRGARSDAEDAAVTEGRSRTQHSSWILHRRRPGVMRWSS